MKPVTGNNNPSADVNKVSVRLDSGGHSFSVELLPKKAFDSASVVEFTVITHKSLLIPSEIFEASAAANYLAVAGLACSSAEQPLCMEAGDKTVVAAVDRSCLETIGKQFDSRAVFTSPLLQCCDNPSSKLHICTYDRVACFKLYGEDGRLRFAEMLRCAGSDDILYYVHELSTQFDIDGFLIYICGDHAVESAKLLKKYFGRVKCE